MTGLLAPKRMIESLEVDGQAVRVFEGATILDACRQLEIDTPTLCFDEPLAPANVCRVCVVEVEACAVRALLLAHGSSRHEGAHGLGARAPLAEARDGAPRLVGFDLYDTRRSRVSRTLRRARRRFGPPTPPSDERDDARTGHHAVPDGRTAATVHQPVKVDNELYVRDYAKCILCYRCVDACGEQHQNTFAIHVAGRGFDARISTELATPAARVGLCLLPATSSRSARRARSCSAPSTSCRAEGEWREHEQTVTETTCPYCGVGCSLASTSRTTGSSM